MRQTKQGRGSLALRVQQVALQEHALQEQLLCQRGGLRILCSKHNFAHQGQEELHLSKGANAILKGEGYDENSLQSWISGAEVLRRRWGERGKGQ